jgi:hypothetical protein
VAVCLCEKRIYLHKNHSAKLIFCPCLTHCLQIAHVHGLDVVYLMKRSEWGLAAWCLGSWWCVLWIRNKLPLSDMPWSTRYNGPTGCLWQVLAVRRYRRGSAGGASHLPTRVVPSSSIDRARQYRARSGLRTKRSRVLLDSTAWLVPVPRRHYKQQQDVSRQGPGLRRGRLKNPLDYSSFLSGLESSGGCDGGDQAGSVWRGFRPFARWPAICTQMAFCGTRVW